MTSSRIFIKGLPPAISSDEFKNHFSQFAPVTDAKLLSHRRIGYVGFQTQNDALQAVKHFNRTYIRMSKISVEIARPINESPKAQSSIKELDSNQGEFKSKNHANKSSIPPSCVPGVKRKRNDDDTSQAKLMEFLDLMQPASKTKIWAPKNNLLNATLDSCDINPEIREKSDHKITFLKSSDIEENLSLPQPPESTTTLRSQVSVPQKRLHEMTDDEWVQNCKNRLLDHEISQDTVKNTANQDLEEKIDSCVINNYKESSLDEESNCRMITNSKNSDRDTDSAIEAIQKNARLFVRNLPYSATEEELAEHFSLFGALEEIHLSVDASGKSKGYAHVQFQDPSSAIEAFNRLDGNPFQGRLLHIIPGYAKREEKLDELAISKLPFTRQKLIKMKAEASTANFNWNSLYMDQDAVNSAIASRLGISKAELLDPASTDSAWKQALAETSLIQESKAYFASKGIELSSFKKHERGGKAILVKNFAFGTTPEELRNIFEEYGKVTRVLMPPAGTIAIVEFSQPGHAKSAFTNLAYRRVKDSILFLEKAPKDLFINMNETNEIASSDIKPSIFKEDQKKISVSDLLSQEDPSGFLETSSLYVRNLNFTTTSERLIETFKPLKGFMSARVITKKDHKRSGQTLSMGFGFIEFKSKEEAQSALKTMDGYNLDGHNIVIKASHRGQDAAEERRREENFKKENAKKTKIVIKNLPFEATKKDVRNLFGAFGKLRSVRLPKKYNNSTRGFAFADFANSREAENALETLKNTHLLGRRLVIEYSTAETLDAEEEIEKMQRRADSQLKKIALHKLTDKDRKKFDINIDEGGTD